MIRFIILFIFFIIVPLELGITYQCFSSKPVVLFDSWIYGFTIMFALFSAYFSFFQYYRMKWNKDVLQGWTIAIIIISAVLVIIVGFIKRKRIVPSDRIKLFNERNIWIVVCFVLVFYFVCNLILKMDYSGVQDGYWLLYHLDTNQYVPFFMSEDDISGIRQATIESFSILVFYMDINELVVMDPYHFLHWIIPGIHLLLSVGCYGFLADQFCVSKENKYQYLLLVFILYVITIFSEDYYLYGIYTNFWEPLTAYTSIFLPFQFGMIFFVQESIARFRRQDITKCFFWSLVVYYIGIMYPIKDPFIILAPEIIGVIIGLIRRWKNATSVL